MVKGFLVSLSAICGMMLALTLPVQAQDAKPDEKPAAKPADKPADKPATPAPAATGGVTLEWKFVKDAPPFYQKLKTATTQTMKVLGQTVEQRNEQEFVFSWKVKEADATKVVLEQKIEAVAMKLLISNNEIKYDSMAKDAADNPLSGFFKPLVGTVFTITLDPAKNAITAVGGRDEFVKKLTEANPQMATMLKTIMSDDQLKQMSEPAFAVLPNKGTQLKVNDVWSRQSNLTMGPIGNYAAKYDYKYVGTEKRTIDGKEVTLHKIEMKTTLTYTAPSAKDATGLPFKIEGGQLSTTDASGVIYFDAEKGRVVDTKTNVALKGKLQITVADQKGDVELEQKQETTVTTTDTNPVAATTAPK